MKAWIRQYTIAITNLFSCAGFTVITPFFPLVAERSGIPSFLVGLILSTFPIASILISLLSPKLMQTIGRNSTLLIGLSLVGISNFLISPIENFSPLFSMLSCFVSRALSGSGAALVSVASISILSSDYPEEFTKLVAVVEVFGGAGFIIGPLVGSLLFSLGGFQTSCCVIGVFVLAFAAVLFLVIGKGREYVIDEKENISMMVLIQKPRVFLNFFMGLTIMLAIGITMPTLEPHLISYGLEEKYVGYWYIINTGAYFASSTLMIRASNLPKQRTMLVGVYCYAVSFFLLGPCPYIFSPSIIVVGVGHHIMGWAGSFQYSIFYVVPLIPYLIETLHTDYNFPIDDRLNDSISGIISISIGLGEVLGPIVGSLLPQLFSTSIKYRMTYFITSAIFLAYGFIYVIVDNILRRHRQLVSKSFFEEEMISLENEVL